jgi:hypothetical protein
MAATTSRSEAWGGGGGGGREVRCHGAEEAARGSKQRGCATAHETGNESGDVSVNNLPFP